MAPSDHMRGIHYTQGYTISVIVTITLTVLGDETDHNTMQLLR
jgi:hypothetical protein